LDNCRSRSALSRFYSPFPTGKPVFLLKLPKMTNLVIVLIAAAAGILLKKYYHDSAKFAGFADNFIIYIALPSAALLFLPTVSLSEVPFFSLLAPFGIFFASLLFFTLLRNLLNLNKKLWACLVLMGGLGNTSFVGFPLTDVYFGEKGLLQAMFFDQAGFFVLSLIAMPLAMYYGSGEIKAAQIVKKIVFFPPFLAFVTAMLMSGFGLKVEGILSDIFRSATMLIAPVALFSVSIKFRLTNSLPEKKYLPVLSLFFKMFAMPVAIFLVSGFFFEGMSLSRQVCIFESCMPPMITASIIASRYDLEGDLAATMVGYGLLVCLPVSYLWFKLLTI
jgi:predicted permease